MASNLKIGDPVWAKMKGFSPWPGKIATPTKDCKKPATAKKPMHCIFFFGTNNYAWILEEFVQPYTGIKDTPFKQGKGANFKEAITAIEEYIKTLPEEEAKPATPSDETEDSSQATPKTKVVTKTNKTPNSTDSTVKKIIKRRSDSTGLKVKKLKTGKTADGLFASLQKSGLSTPNNSGSRSNSLSPSPTKIGLLARPTYIPRPVTPPLDVENVSDTLKHKNIKASVQKFGFLGLGIMGQGMVKNLINSGHTVTVWNRTPSKCRDFVKAGALKGLTPADVVASSDITFCCVSDPQAAKEMVFGNCGVLQEIKANKGYVEMTSIDPETSQDISEAIIFRGGRYLEAPVCGSKKSSEDGSLIILGAGERSLFDDCQSCFEAMGKHAFYLGDTGNGCKINLVLNMIFGNMLAGLAEAMAVVDRAGLSQKDVVEILELSSLNCPAIVDKSRAIIEGTFPTNMPLQHMQKNLRLALGIGDQLEQALPITATCNEVYKNAKRLGYGEHDVAAVYVRTRY